MEPNSPVFVTGGTPVAEQAEYDRRQGSARLAELLLEWLDTPFFKKKSDWQKWTESYRPRVVLALRLYMRSKG